MTAPYDFQSVLDTGVGQPRKLGKILLEINQPQDVTQANPHQLSLMVAAQPQMLVSIA